MHRLPMVPDTGIPTHHFQTGGLMVASQMSVPLTEGVVVTMVTRGLSYRHSEFS